MKKSISFFLFLLCTSFLFAQDTAKVEGYVFESGNRGYLEGILIQVLDDRLDTLISECISNNEGFFSCTVPINQKFTVVTSHEYFHPSTMSSNTIGVAAGGKSFLKFELKRAPGYMFEITIAEERNNDETPVDAIKSSTIEVYNNTAKEMVLTLQDYQLPDFKVHLKKGNHYTLMIRKDGYQTKRMEAFVDVKGCILCFEGIGEVKPGVTDNLTEQNSFGTLLANVELERIHPGMEIKMNTIYYEAASYDLSDEAKIELDKLKLFIMDNPNLVIELGSHTDSRGNPSGNLELSQKRANTAVNYVLREGTIDPSRLKAKGYGLTTILNHCKQGVSCSNEEHAENRRTELKLIDILSEGNYMSKSLASMKQAEHMDALLAEIQNQGVIEVPADTKEPTSKRASTRSRNNKKKKNSRKRRPETTQIEKEVSKVVSEITQDTQVKEERTFQDLTPTPQEIKEVEEIESQMIESPVVTKEIVKESISTKSVNSTATKSISKVTTEITTLEKPEEIVQEVVVNKMETSIVEEIDDLGSLERVEEEVILEESEEGIQEEEPVQEEVEDVIAEVNNAVVEELTRQEEVSEESMEFERDEETAEWMTGHHIVLVETEKELSSTHPMFSIFNDVNLLISPVTKKHMYLYGGFQSEDEAQEYMVSNVYKMFPGAYLISF